MTRVLALTFLCLLVAATGCRQPYGSTAQAPGGFGNSAFSTYPGPAGGNQVAGGMAPGSPQYNQLTRQFDSMNRQLSQFNSDNENLHTQIAALQQRLQNANNYNDQLRQQLAESVNRLQQQNTQLASNPSSGNSGDWSAASSGPPAQFAGATIRANNGLMQNLQNVQLPGFRTWMDGDVIRIEGPTDRLFVSGTWQINPNDAASLARLASAIRQYFPQQVVGVEAHWDGSPVQPATTSHHQLTANQALAVFDVLVKSGLPNAQVFTMAVGSNRPRHNTPVQNGISPNRRIEIVIYPETYR